MLVTHRPTVARWHLMQEAPAMGWRAGGSTAADEALDTAPAILYADLNGPRCGPGHC